MNFSLLISLILIVSFAIQMTLADKKYSKEANENFYKLDKPFRIQKLNILWETATKILDYSNLNRLLEDLKHQDKEELELKRLKADNQDKDGTKELEVRRQLRMIKKKYGLGDEVQFSSNNSDDPNSIPLFKDVKLNNLWKKIHKLDLTEEQLTILKEEFHDFEGKLHNYHQIADKYHDQVYKKSNVQNDENHIDPDSFESLVKDNFYTDEMDQKLQEKHLELKEHYQKINDMIYNKQFKYKGGFEEEKAARLWQMALKSDFNSEELEELKDKLLHFEGRIKKLNYFVGQMEKTNVKDHVMDDETHANYHNHITKRVQELDGHVKKLHHQLEEKILSRHSEL